MRIHAEPVDTGRFFPARVAQVQRRLDGLQAQLRVAAVKSAAGELDELVRRVETLQQELTGYRDQLGKLKRLAAPLLALRRLLLRIVG